MTRFSLGIFEKTEFPILSITGNTVKVTQSILESIKKIVDQQIGIHKTTPQNLARQNLPTLMSVTPLL
ncbi:hypothetical protein [Sphingobacterium paludis]|uniref:Uncharacterized protein n=1 Tax=Sphingobacterium paludis TaxID=1476465 RepID=A0A4R7D5I4_9SPHI|nr:hypothetical protein [Sphingobacterium paludis]TDS14954.1 hypothetical protein B0I21_103456 [Sphingobacterium paludis]